jgi:hypothetical protein
MYRLSSFFVVGECDGKNLEKITFIGSTFFQFFRKTLQINESQPDYLLQLFEKSLSRMVQFIVIINSEEVF